MPLRRRPARSLDLVPDQGDPVELRGAVFGNAAFDKAVFLDCDFRGADFSLVTEGLLGTIFDARFERCDLRDTRWAGRSLFRARFLHCKFAGSSGPPASVTDLQLVDPDLPRRHRHAGRHPRRPLSLLADGPRRRARGGRGSDARLLAQASDRGWRRPRLAQGPGGDRGPAQAPRGAQPALRPRSGRRLTRDARPTLDRRPRVRAAPDAAGDAAGSRARARSLRAWFGPPSPTSCPRPRRRSQALPVRGPSGVTTPTRGARAASSIRSAGDAEQRDLLTQVEVVVALGAGPGP
ncbi:MAG: pentapeptide repeat-containing protein [Kofleriaceae bacterium]|nr:pentapeptide repeat-containing protein [Kofleriaceae bacterium]